MIYATRLDRTREPNHQQMRRPVHIHLLLPGRGALTPQPRHERTATPLPFNEKHSFHRNARRAASLSNRSSVVPAERHQWTPAVRTIDPSLSTAKRHGSTNPPASDRNTSFHLNDQQSVPAERQPADPFVQARLWRAVFASPPPTLATLCGRPNEPNLHPPHTTHAESRRTGGTRSTFRAAVTQPQSTSATASPSLLTF